MVPAALLAHTLTLVSGEPPITIDRIADPRYESSLVFIAAVIDDNDMATELPTMPRARHSALRRMAAIFLDTIRPRTAAGRPPRPPAAVRPLLLLLQRPSGPATTPWTKNGRSTVPPAHASPSPASPCSYGWKPFSRSSRARASTTPSSRANT